MSELQELTQENFRQIINEGTTPVLVDFWAPWCGPCRLLKPELEAAAMEWGEKVREAKLNVDEQPDLAEEYGIRSIPNLILFINGKPVRQFVGFIDRRDLTEAITAS